MGAIRWQGRADGGWSYAVLLGAIFLAGAGMLVAGLASEGKVGVAVAIFLVVVLIPVALIILAFRHIVVSVDDEAVRVRYAMPFTTSVAIADIERVEYLEDLRPLEWGGWGYRGSRRLFRKAAIVIRRGPAFVLHLRDRSTLAVTVDDAAAGVAELQGLLSTR